MLKLYQVSYHLLNGDDTTFLRYILAYNPCHAVNLLYREFDSRNELNCYRHDDCIEIPCLNPAIFKSK